MAQKTAQEVREEVKDLLTSMTSVEVFDYRRNPAIADNLSNLISATEAGKDGKVVEFGTDLLKAGRAIFSAFLRYSIFDKKTGEGEDAQILKHAFFKSEIEYRVSEGFEPDLIAKLVEAQKVLETAVKAETNGSFVARVDAYNAMRAVISKVDEEAEAA